ncbi:MAG: FHA domain-containing protein, partial [Myxococcota bacterium]
MLQLIINEKGGPSRTESFDKNEVTIGRVQGNDIILPKGNISKRHSRIVMKDGKFIIVDLKSTNGTYVNGKKITAPQVIKETDKVYIGDFTLQIEREAAGLAIEDEPLAPRGRGASEAGEEIDLFGEQASMDRHADPAPAAPSLIDENFDQEFEAPAAEPEPQSRLPQPSRRASIRPEPSPPELELDEEFGAGDGMAPAVEIDNSAFAAPEPVMDPPVP